MRIALYHNLPSGGAKRSLYEWTRRLATRQEVSLYTMRAADEAYLDLRPLVRETLVYPLACPFHNRPLTPSGLALRFVDLRRLCAAGEEIARQIDAAGPDVVLVNHCWYTQAPYVLRYLHSRSVYFCQEPPRWLLEPLPPRAAGSSSGRAPSGTYRLLRALFHWTFKRLLVKVDAENTIQAHEILVNSHYSREVVYRTYGRFARFSRLGVDAVQFQPIETEKAHAVLSVGALAALKGHDFVIQAVSRIPDHRRPEVYVVADRGAEAEKAHLEHLADQWDVRVTIHQRVSEEQLVTLYNRAKVTACASIMEPFGLVPLESMACGTPVIAVREGGLRETVVPGQTGLLTERDPEEFAQALDEVLGDGALRLRLGQQGRTYVREQWTWERSAEQLEQHLARVARQPS